MSSRGYDHTQQCSSHYKKSKCGCCKDDTDFNYAKVYSNWLARKEKCKPKQCNENFKYDGVYIPQRKCCPELTDWLEVFEGSDDEEQIVFQ